MKITSYAPEDGEDTTNTNATDAAANASQQRSDPAPKDQPLSREELDKASLDAFSAGLDVAEGKAEPKPNADGTTTVDVIDDDEVDENGNIVPKAKPDAKPDAAKPDAAKPDAKDGEDKPDEEIEKEITERGLKADTAKRFRELATGNKRARELEQEIEPLREAAERASQWETMMERTGAQPQQFGMAMGFLHAVNSGDPKLMNMAFDAMQDELQQLGQRLGRPLSAYDPLDADPELKKRVKDGDLERADAEALLRTRTEAKLRDDAEAKRVQQTERQTAAQAGVEAVRNLGNELAALEDQTAPGKGVEIYRQKIAVITPSVKLIQRTLTPDKWPEAIKELYLQLPAIQPVAAAKPPVRNPTRPGNTTGTQVLPKPKDDVEAFSRGLEKAVGRG